MSRPNRRVPLWLKIAWTAFIALLVPVYWAHYGPQNFLWFSDLALFAAAAALWLESRLLASMVALAVIIPEGAWAIDFTLGLVAGTTPIGLAEYMFDPSKPLSLRALSLFHLPLLVAGVWMVRRLGYDRRALPALVAVAWVVLPLTYALTEPSDNINWVHGPGGRPQTTLDPRLYLLLIMLAVPVAVYLPTHLLLARFVGGRPAR